MEGCCYQLIHMITRCRLIYKGWMKHEKLININIIKNGQITKIITNKKNCHQLELNNIEKVIPLIYQYLQLTYKLSNKQYKILFSQEECKYKKILFPLDIEINNKIVHNPFVEISIIFEDGKFRSIMNLIDSYLGPTHDFHKKLSISMQSIQIAEILQINNIPINYILCITILNHDFITKEYNLETTLEEIYLDNLLIK